MHPGILKDILAWYLYAGKYFHHETQAHLYGARHPAWLLSYKKSSDLNKMEFSQYPRYKQTVKNITLKKVFPTRMDMLDKFILYNPNVILPQ